MRVAKVAHGHAVPPCAHGARPGPSVLLLLALAAIPPHPTQAQTQLDLAAPELIEQGAGLFAQSCAVGYCHGSAGRAARGPELRDRRWSPQDLYRITHDGLDGTSMPAWKDILSDQDIWAVTGYILSLSGQPPDGPMRVEVGASQTPKPELSDTAQHGRELFFDLNREKRCGLCHRMGNKGRAIGPNLAQAATGKTVAELTASIKRPHSSISFGFHRTTLETSGGEIVAGVLRDNNDGVIRIYDTAAFPPPLRTFYSEQISSMNESQRSSMPSSSELGYSDDDVRAIVAYLRSGG